MARNASVTTYFRQILAARTAIENAQRIVDSKTLVVANRLAEAAALAGTTVEDIETMYTEWVNTPADETTEQDAPATGRKGRKSAEQTEIPAEG